MPRRKRTVFKTTSYISTGSSQYVSQDHLSATANFQTIPVVPPTPIVPPTPLIPPIPIVSPTSLVPPTPVVPPTLLVPPISQNIPSDPSSSQNIDSRSYFDRKSPKFWTVNVVDAAGVVKEERLRVGDAFNLDPRKRVVIEFNEVGQWVGESGGLFGGFLGAVASIATRSRFLMKIGVKSPKFIRTMRLT